MLGGRPLTLGERSTMPSNGAREDRRALPADDPAHALIVRRSAVDANPSDANPSVQPPVARQPLKRLSTRLTLPTTAG
jgi:cell division septation protein DedD